MENQLMYLLNLIAKKNNIQFNNEEAKVQLLSHPYYPSINSITDLFNYFNVDNLALEVPTTEDTFIQLPDTFLAQINEDSTSYLVVVSKNKKGAFLEYHKNKSKSISIHDFLELWTGITLVIEKYDNKKVSNSLKRGNIKGSILILATIMLGYIFISSEPPFFQLVHFFLSCIGVYISFLIVQHELGLHSKILDKFCSGQSKSTNCNAVLSSKGASVFGLFKLSDVGFVYFLSLTVCWVLISLNNVQEFSAIVLISVLAVPFTLFSIYYQWHVVKSWCPLCLTVVGLLWLQFATLFLKPIHFESLYIIDFSYVFYIFSLLTTITLWLNLSPLLKKEQQFKKLEISHIKFKRNFKLFKTLLSLDSQIDTTIPISNEITFGNKNALLNILIVTNPMCGYCKESHTLVKKILQQNNPDIKITIRFNVQVADVKSVGVKIASKLLEIYSTCNQEFCLEALSDIYGDMDANSWLQKWGEASSLKYLKTLKVEKDWCASNKINFTPAILINGQQFPNEYDRMDLLYFIDDLIEEQIEAEIQPKIV